METNILEKDEADLAVLAAKTPKAISKRLTSDEVAELDQVANLICKVKGMQKATTMGMVIIGFHLRAIKEKHFPSTTKGGRPNASLNRTGYQSFSELCFLLFNISDQTFLNWIKMAESVEEKMHLSGDDLATTFEKLPWDWSSEEQQKIENVVSAITEGKTQKQILSWQNAALIDLGLAGSLSKRAVHGTNNPSGKNGADKKQNAASFPEHSAALLAQARDCWFGTDEEDKCTPDSLVGRLFGELESKPPHYTFLTPAERSYIADQVLAPLLKNLRELK